MGRAEVSSLALGDQHTLFLDKSGGVWAVGCTLEGQCGLGTPIEELARQHRCEQREEGYLLLGVSIS